MNPDRETGDEAGGAGRLIGGRYRVLRRLGGGGMAEVYLAEDGTLGRLVAVKVLLARFADDEEFVERFRLEARAAALLNHQNIVAIYDRGGDGGDSYIVMEYVRGETLKQRIRRQGRLAPDEAVGVTLDLLAALQVAHERHIVHRDITAQNVLIDELGRVKVTDFGIARIGASSITRSGAMLGTSHYLSPEQAKGEPADERSDLYATGVVLYEMLTGAVPFEAETDVAVLLKHAQEEPREPRALVPQITPALNQIVLRALAKDREQRYQSAAQFATDLRSVQTNEVQAGARTGEDGKEAAVSAASAAVAAAKRGLAVPEGPAPAVARSAPPAPPRSPVLPPTTPRSPGAASAAPSFTARSDQAPTRSAVARRERETVAQPRRRRRRVPWLWVLAAAIVAVVAVGAYVAYQVYFTGAAPVPSVVGKAEPAAIGALRNAGFRVGKHDGYSDRFAAGLVMRQQPKAGSELAEGGRVHVWISRGPVHVSTPDVVNLTAAEAAARLKQRGLVGKRATGSSATVAEGSVYKQRPSVGTTLERGAAVTYWVSSGPPLIAVPDVVGLSVTAAAGALEDEGFEVNVQPAAGLGEVPGTVIDQEPTGGAKAEKGTEITIWVALL